MPPPPRQLPKFGVADDPEVSAADHAEVACGPRRRRGGDTAFPVVEADELSAFTRAPGYLATVVHAPGC